MTQENVRELASEGRTEPKEFPTICGIVAKKGGKATLNVGRQVGQ
jgi:hypothetical protein